MTVSRKPPRQIGQGRVAAPPLPRVDVDAIINRGGSVAREEIKPLAGVPRARKSVLMNLPVDTLDAIAAAIAARPVKIPRQTWIEEAIQEKLQREQGPSTE
jgi:hypothetical protein